MTHQNPKILIFSFLFVWTFFIYLGNTSMDPDFGWHIRLGQLILNSGIPMKDPFSYSMPSFPFIDHEWLINILLYATYLATGYFGLALIFASLTALSLYIPFLIEKKHFLLNLPFLILGAVTIGGFSGIRPQILTWFFFSILLSSLYSKFLWTRYRYLLPLLFIVWANIHGGFSIGVIILFIHFITTSIQLRKIDKTNFVIISLSLLATLINPYGIRLWGEVWMQISDPSLRITIVEWMPVVFRMDPAFLLLLITSLIFIIKYKKNFSLFQLVIYFLLLFMGLTSQRHIPLWVIATLPLVTEAVQCFYLSISKISHGTNRFGLSYLFFITLVILFSSYQFFTLLRLREINYPQDAISYLHQYNVGNLFSPYNWGGYLIWKIPERKIFIDGRMPSWRWDAPNNQEADWAQKEYNNVVYGSGSLGSFVEKYKIHQILWNTKSNANVNSPHTNFKPFRERLVLKLFGPQKNPSFYSKINDLKWKLVYKDKISTIYQKP